MSSDRLPAVSLFSNCGAGDLGYLRSGFEFEVMAEIDARRLSIASLNLPNAGTIPGDLRETWPRVVEEYKKRCGSAPPALLAACPPCQGMSSARSGRGRGDDPDAGSRDARNLLVGVIARVTHALAPRIVVVENVPAFLTRVVRHPRTGTPISAAALLARSLRQRYCLTPLITDLADYGVPQTRRRAFLCFVRRDELGAAALVERGRAPFPRPTHVPEYSGAHTTLRQAFEELNAASLDGASAASAGTGMHAVPVWNAERYEMVAAIARNSGASAWQNADCISCGKPAPEDAASCVACGTRLTRPVVEDPSGTLRLVRGFRSSSYRRMSPDRPAATITTASGHIGSDRTLHPWENRVLSPLECAYLQTFPSNFDWGNALEDWGSTNVRAMIGEAVPPGFTEIHGEVLTGLLTSKYRRPSISSSDRRVRRATTTLARAEVIARTRSDR